VKEQLSAKRCEQTVKPVTADDIDADLLKWLMDAYELARSSRSVNHVPNAVPSTTS